MKVPRLSIFLACLLLAPAASACVTLSPEQHRAAVRADLNTQRDLAQKLAERADSVVIARVDRVSTDGLSADFAALEQIQGVKVDLLTGMALPQLVTVGCRASSWFEAAGVVEGETYLLYIAGRKVLRAGTLARDPKDISLRAELRIIRRAAPNNASKPTPLRGAAGPGGRQPVEDRRP